MRCGSPHLLQLVRPHVQNAHRKTTRPVVRDRTAATAAASTGHTKCQPCAMPTARRNEVTTESEGGRLQDTSGIMLEAGQRNAPRSGQQAANKSFHRQTASSWSGVACLALPGTLSLQKNQLPDACFRRNGSSTMVVFP